jgi:Zn-dependent metalloprotease
MRRVNIAGSKGKEMKTPQALMIYAAALAAVVSTSPAQTQPDTTGRLSDAKIAAARNALAAPHLSRAMNSRQEFGLDANHSFEAINANQDDLGWTHVRMQQFYGGVRIRDGSLISHSDPSGNYTYNDALKRNINISLTPAVTKQEALDVAALQPSHLSDYSAAPEVELVIYPVLEQVTDPASLAAQSGPAGSQTTSHVKEYRLAYEVQTYERPKQSRQRINAWVYIVDAQNGALLSSSSLIQSSIGSGSGEFNQNVKFLTLQGPGGFVMFDSGRNYHTWDYDYSFWPVPPNTDPDDIWGDGLPFAGDAAASVANRQSAMVDGHFGALVYWELMSNVFGRQGPDGNKKEIDIYAHYGPPGWNNAEYDLFTKSVYLGDGKGFQALDVVGHELGHALNNYTANIADLNESNSDIWGAMTTFYLNGGGFAAQSNTIPLDKGVWTGVRDMKKPSQKGPGHSDYWSLPLVLEEVHALGEPNNRAFYFLAEGASGLMTDASYSELLPFGMKGIGTNDAARIWYDALVNWTPGNQDYWATRQSCLWAAMARFGILSPQYRAVMNAYAGIGVGDTAPDYPASKIVPEAEPNNTWQTATHLPDPLNIVGVPQHFVAQGTSSGADDDWFMVTVKGNQEMLLGIYPRSLSPVLDLYQVEVFDQFFTSMGKTVSTNAVFNPLDVTAPSGFGVPQRIYLKVTRLAGVGTTAYDLAVQYL